VTDAAYIRAIDWADYGIVDATYDQVEAASRLADAYMGRPEGVLWLPDATGQPGWMAALTPTKRFFLTGDITPGSSVQLSFPGVKFGPSDVGQVVILSRTDKAAAEPCVITAASSGSITLDGVQFGHPQGASVEFGLTLLSEVGAPGLWKTIRLGRTPVARLLAGFGRCGRLAPRSYDPLAWIAATTDWTQFDVSACDINH
jgi:hypothetical protein